MCLRISQVLDRDGNTSRWTKVETKVPFKINQLLDKGNNSRFFNNETPSTKEPA